MIFDQSYSEAYDLLNQGKNYGSEVKFVIDLFKKHASANLIGSILDLGSGSGQHLMEFSHSLQNKPDLFGVDVSEHLCDFARSSLGSRATIVTSNIADFKIDVKFDLVTSLYHVVNYQSHPKALIDFLKAIKRNLKNDGIAVLDFWNLSAWYADPPIVRVKEIATSNFVYKRTSSPTVDYLNGTVDVEIVIEKRSLETEDLIKISKEIHKLKAFTPLELELACSLSELKLVALGPWMEEERSLRSNDWYGFAVLSH
jgi:SAM-dependent methyltransferase